MPNYVTHCYDNLRTGWNPNETILTPDSIYLHYRGRTCLGQLFTYPVQGQVYAQPLYVENVPFAGSNVDAVLVATEENWVYAFDAGSAQQLWARQLIEIGEQLVTSDDIQGCTNIAPYIGITSAPVIDPTSMTAYIVAKAKSTAAPVLFYHRLYAIALENGQDRMPPVVIQAAVDYPDSTAQFSPQWQLQRPGLLLANNLLYIGFGGHCDLHSGTYHGWVLAYNPQTLEQVGVFSSTESGQGGIWQSGRGLACDADGSVYCMTGNAHFSGNDYGDAVLKLSATAVIGNLIALEGFFAPCNTVYLDNNDVDLGSGGPMLLPDQPGPYPHLLVAAGKEGTVYLLNRDNLGGYNSMPRGWPRSQQCSDNAVTALFRVLGTAPADTENRDALFGGPAYYAPAGTSPRIYYCPQDDLVKAFYYDQVQGRLVGPFDKGNWSVPGGAIPVVSSNGEQVGTGILWVLSRGNPRVLTAYDLNPDRSLSDYLLCDIEVGEWSGSLGPPASVVNGRVYAACDNRVVVFGLVPAPKWMNVDATLLRKSGRRRTIQVIVTDAGNNAPVPGATVAVFNDSTGGRTASGITNQNGTVTLTYPGCFETGNGGPSRIEDSCPATANAPGYAEANFDTPTS